MSLLFLSQLPEQFYVVFGKQTVYVEKTPKQVSAAFVFFMLFLSVKNARVEYLFIVFDVVLQDNAVGLVRLMPQ